MKTATLLPYTYTKYGRGMGIVYVDKENPSPDTFKTMIWGLTKDPQTVSDFKGFFTRAGKPPGDIGVAAVNLKFQIFSINLKRLLRRYLCFFSGAWAIYLDKRFPDGGNRSFHRIIRIARFGLSVLDRRFRHN